MFTNLIGGGPAPAVVLFQDDFDDTDLTNLSAHTPNTGTSWTHVAFSEPQINSNVVHGTGNGWSVANSTNADATIIWNFVRGSGSAQDLRCMFRASNTTWQDAWEYHVHDFTAQLMYWQAGSSTNVGAAYSADMRSRAHEIRVELTGNDIKVYHDGALRASTTNALFNTVAYHGIGFEANSALSYGTAFEIQEYNAL